MTQFTTGKMKVGDRVTRSKLNAFRYHREMNGTVISITHDNRCYIKWDEKNTTGQQHSTVNPKFLILLTTQKQ